jgi:hypothetical protein
MVSKMTNKIIHLEKLSYAPLFGAYSTLGGTMALPLRPGGSDAGLEQWGWL